MRNTTADYITGAVSASEGIRDSFVLLNGPLGCRFYHGYASGQSLLKESELWSLRGELQLENAMDDRLLRSQYFAGTPQVPGSNLRYEDYIFGTWEQLERALLDILGERRYSFFTVIQTPGTSLLGEALEQRIGALAERFETPWLYVESPHFSENAYQGYDETMIRLLSVLTPAEPGRGRHTKANGDRRRPCVNLFGFFTYEKFLEGDVAEIRRLLALCGVDVSCVVGVDCTVEQLRTISRADLNLFLSPERCSQTCTFVKETLGLPVLDFGCMPVGFDLTEQFVCTVAKRLGTDAKEAVTDIERARARAFYFLARMLGAKGFPKELPYAIEGERSMLYAWMDFLSGYLGMRPAAVHILYEDCPICAGKTPEELLRCMGAEEALQRDIAGINDAIVIGNANTIMEAFLHSANLYGIEVANPSSGYLHVVPKTYLGSSGALYLLEQLLNGVRMLRAWE